MWHASIAYLVGKNRAMMVPKCVRGWSKTQQTRARATLVGMLHGVGAGPAELFFTIPSWDAVSMQLQRALSDDEIEQIPAAWRKLPAIDERGPIILLETIT